jgi:hypothetical protein
MKWASAFSRFHFLQIEKNGRGNGRITPFCVWLIQPIGNVSARGKWNQNINAGETRKMRLHLMAFRFPCSVALTTSQWCPPHGDCDYFWCRARFVVFLAIFAKFLRDSSLQQTNQVSNEVTTCLIEEIIIYSSPTQTAEPGFSRRRTNRENGIIR